MTNDDARYDETNSDRTGVGRRSLLRAMGVGTALSAAGVAGAQVTETPNGETETPGGETETPEGGGTGGGGGGGGDAVDPTFGFPAASAGVEPPVEPDRTVEIRIRPRDGAPIPEFFFEPTGLAIDPGDTVMFDYVTPHHTVTAYHPGHGFVQRVPDGVPPFSAPVVPAGGYWLYTFDAEGVYDYHCGPHEAFGHAGRIVCGSTEGFAPLPDLCADQSGGSETETPSEGGEDGGGEEELRLPFLTAHTVLSDPALDPENVLSEGSVSWDDLAPKSKQLFVGIEGFPPCDDEC